MIVQQDSKLLPVIQKYGCYLMCILFWVNRLTKRGFDRHCINELYDLIPDMWMERDCYIRSPLDIFGFLGLSVRSVRKEPASYVCDENEFEILEFERTWKGGTYSHFVCGNGDGVVTYDPSGVSNAVKFGYLKSKRVFEV